MLDIALAAAAVAGTAVIMLLIVNLMIGVERLTRGVEPTYGVEDAAFLQTLDAILGPALVRGNDVTLLHNGDQIFPAMLDAILAARRTITFETYIYWSGGIGKRFADALSSRARDGVRVHVLLDWAGSGNIDESYIDEMRRAGVQIERYRAPTWRNLARLNNRTHRKLLVADGEIGFTGGVGIADPWCGHAQDPAHWRDTHFRVKGPAVAQMQSAFVENWIEATGAVLHGDDYFPAPRHCGDLRAQVFTSSPGSGSQKMQLMYLLCIAAARKSVKLSESYFVPDALSTRALVAALGRGVSVQIILPGPHIDFRIVRRASRAAWGPLLAAGAEIYEYQPTMYHCKLFIVDDLWTSAGSTNFDNRSFRVNDEANLSVYDAVLARELAARFEEDLRKSRRITYEEWQGRPWREKLWERTVALVSSQL